ncbi:hypothetical protein K1T35_47880 (plasmid) [Pseudonocardia sp. DSM 110487]|uniref:helix-turn-helix domain-containing protein n=1 Tax=Pseudonocardia sp. DSM 110487 TaxID=2865833 RepID=UPI001C6A2EA4|nr:helix-turn-helix domain-containing protein [Pseudonocardia sp. DSM 110487]QYN41071.1 hypothetical protein K1T35_47880 [Pseudonocardia sp. DSM 110487]
MPGPRSDTTAGRPTSASFAARLQGLYSDRKLTKRKPYSDPAVARAIFEVSGKRVSPQYLNQLRHGRKGNPSSELVEALATVFEVNRAYFYDDNTPASPDDEQAARPPEDDDSAELSPEALQIGLRAAGLSKHWQNAVIEFINHARKSEGLDDAGAAR